MGTQMTRKLGRSGLEISALGLGTWAIGGPWDFDGKPAGWGNVNDNESIRAIQHALELGITFFDTADVYGCGHSERILGQALASQRDKVVIATKFGHVFDEATRSGAGHDHSPAYIRSACEASLRRLNSDYIDLYQLHSGISTVEEAEEIITSLEALVQEGKIRFYGASIDDPTIAQAFAQGPHCTAIQQQMNIFGGNDEVLSICEKHNLASICRTPLAMGLLSGKYVDRSTLSKDDVRLHTPWWDYFKEGRMEEWLSKIARIRTTLTSDGRTLTQGALGWLWARSPLTIPIPGFRTMAQVEENVQALQYGAISDDQFHQVQTLLS